MQNGRWRPRLSADYVAAARAYALDLASALLLFFSAAVMADRVWRFPFDDELIALMPIERSQSALELLSYYLKGGDIHPPLSFLLFYELEHLGFSEAAMRLCSLAMTALALALFHLLALTLLVRRARAAVAPTTRLIAVLLFGLSPLAIGQGDAIRWYPLFAMLVALFTTLYLFGGNSATRLWSAVALGLAASTNFIAIIVAIPFALYRYGLQRQFRAAFDIAFGLVVLVFASLGIVSAYSIFVARLGGVMRTEFGVAVAQAILTNVLGFFGGDALGVSQAWVIVPVVAISALAMFSLIDRKQPADAAHLLLLMFAATLLMVLSGFAKPRSFLYLAPVLAALLTLFLDRQARNRSPGVALLTPVAAIANINSGSHPFKRNSAIPYQSILDFIETNESGKVLIVSSDPVVPWVLRHRQDHDRRCVSYFLNERECLAAPPRYDSIFVIVGHSDRSADAAFMRKFDGAVSELTAGRRKAATIHAGVDADADLKSRLTGVVLDSHILTVDLYR